MTPVSPQMILTLVFTIHSSQIQTTKDIHS